MDPNRVFSGVVFKIISAEHYYNIFGIGGYVYKKELYGTDALVHIRADEQTYRDLETDEIYQKTVRDGVIGQLYVDEETIKPITETVKDIKKDEDIPVSQLVKMYRSKTAKK